jgi:hypothetical protein
MKSPSSSKRPCLYIKTNGEACGSHALRGRCYCFYHHESAKRDRRRARFQNANMIDIELLPCEDPESVQVNISEIAYALLDHRIDQRTAATLLYSMQLAISNLRNLNNAPRKLRSYAVDVLPHDTFDDDLLDEAPESASESKTTMPDAPDACMHCPEDKICDTCEHFIDPITLEFPSLEVIPPRLTGASRKPPVSAIDLGTQCNIPSSLLSS